METATLTPPAPVKAGYKMPKVSVGMNILWWHDGNKNGKPHVGIVCKIGTNNNIDISVVRLANTSLFPVTGSRHVDDPDAKEYDRTNAGGWDLTEETKEVRKALSIIME